MEVYSLNNFSTWLTVVMLVIFSTMVGIASQYLPGARFMPFVVGIPGIIFCLVQLIWDWLRVRHSSAAPHADGHAIPAEFQLPEFGPHTWAAELRTWGYFLVFIVLLLMFGFVIAAPILVIVYLHRVAKVTLPISVLAAVGYTALLYLMFERLLHFQLFRGLLAPGLYRAMGL